MSLTMGCKRSTLLVINLICAAIGLPGHEGAEHKFIGPFLDCVEPSLASPGNYIPHFGYVTTATTTVNFPFERPVNFYSPSTLVRDIAANLPTLFLPGFITMRDTGEFRGCRNLRRASRQPYIPAAATLAAGATASVNLDFTNSDPTSAITYTLRVLGAGNQ